MPVPRLWPLLAFMFVPGVFAWWSGRRLVRKRDDPTLAERLLERAEHAQRVTLLSAACLAFAAGSYYWFAVLGLVLGHWIGDYPSRRVVLDERWAPATYVLWHLRFHLAWLGFWFALLVAPTVIQASGVWRWPVAGTLAVLLGLWAWRYTEAFVWLVRARPRPWRTEWQPIVDRARATRPRLFDMPVPGGRFVNAFAFPSTRVPSVLFTDPALELLSAREQAAVFAHEVAHLEHYDRRRCRIVSAITYGLVATATLGSALALDRLPAGLFMPFWSLGLITGFLWKTSRHKAHETESDVRALALCDAPEALISGLTKLAIAGRMPRRWSSELEHGSSHPSLARRLHAIRRVAPIPVMPFDDTLVVATTRPTSLVVLDRDGVWWVEARDPAERDPETLRQTARSRWSVPYDELVELRVRAFWWGGGASLVARDRSGSSRAVQIAPTEVEALQRKLAAVEHRLAHDTLVTEPPAVVGRFTAMALGIVVVFVEGLLSLGLITGFVAIIRPSRAALAAVAGVAGACLLVFAGDLGVRSPTRPTLPDAAAAALVGPGVKLVDTLLTSRPTVVGETEHGTLARTAQLELPWRVGVLRVSPVGTRAAVMTREAARAPDRFLVLRLEGGRADLEGRDLRFIDERNALTLVESATHMRLQHLELAEASASADWSIVLPPLTTPTVSSVRASGWAVVGYDGDTEEFVGLVGRIGGPGVSRYRWAVDQTESVDSEAVEILPDGRGFRAIAGVTRLARLPWGTWIYDRGVRRQTRVWRLNGNAQDLVAVWPTAAECHLVDHRAADVVCVGDRNERTLVWRFGLEAGPTRPLAVRDVARRTGVSPDGRFVALWGKEDLVLVDLDRAEATRRPLPPDARVPTHLVPLGDRLVALFRRPRATPVVEVFDTRW